ncbi:hypothetical protein RDWZM_009375 [Blomia tropicalis]|uniref:Small ribosomal subunit protein uS10 domain-containing protein n=1 Tax=Blomia tropicalis TaxID=40697 RepID=A0A9Q0M3Z8_BLOTA|nr:39S ribosomal protein L48, mitochondrial [Blomia tropicalis]KAJ6218218.1 hypothetical protein RDWZM_009375 [Blomia tropicalis]
MLASFAIKGVHEPEYLDYLRPQIPYYKLINIQIKGYDYAVLENYGSYLHRLSNKLGLKVSKFWCMPNTTKKIETLLPESSVVESTYELNLYERNIQIENISGRLMSLFVEVVHRSLPVGVYLSIHKHDERQHELSRYIEDHQLIEFKSELKMLLSHKQDDVEETTKKK